MIVVVIRVCEPFAQLLKTPVWYFLWTLSLVGNLLGGIQAYWVNSRNTEKWVENMEGAFLAYKIIGLDVFIHIKITLGEKVWNHFLNSE